MLDAEAIARNPEAEQALASRVARGDHDAFRQVYEACAGRAMAVALRILHRRPEAEEVLQDTFAEVWRRARDFDAARGSLVAWVLNIARSRAIDRFRLQQKVATLAQSAVPPTPSVHFTPPPEAAEQSEDRVRIQVALKALPPEQRNVLELAFFAGLSHSEISRHTGDRLGTVKTRLRLGMEKLASALAE